MGRTLDVRSLCSGNTFSTGERAVVAEFVRAVNAGEIEALAALFAEDAHVNDQLRNFWGREAIDGWLRREIVAENVELDVLAIRKHYDVVMLSAGIRGDFESPRTAWPMVFDLHFTLHGSRIVRLLILLARVDTSEPELRRAP